MLITRRGFVAAVTTGAALGGQARALHAQTVAAAGGQDRLVLLGNKGGPAIRGYAPSPSANLLVHKSIPYVIDAGYGVTFKLVEAKLPLPSLRYVFITHHHSDHNLELGPLLYNAWAVGLRTPVEAYGPVGIEPLLSAYWESNKFDIETRMADEGRPDLRKLVSARTYSEGAVLKMEDMTVTALRNLHPPITESYALKFAFGGKTVVFSGDTAYFPPLAAFAKGADILVHELMYGPALEALVRRNPNAATLMSHLKASHTEAEDVGRLAAEAGVKTLVLNHFVPADDRTLTDQVWTDAVRKTFGGPIIVGKDLLEIPLG
jgi:ribonuclease BN (tRNA processing enzyme)